MITFLNNQLTGQKQKKLPLKCIENTNKITKKITQKTLIVSVPVYTSNNDFALLYVEGLSSGEILVFKKKWK